MAKLQFLITFFFFSCGLFAQDFKTQSVALFKDGNAFFIKKGKVATNNKNYSIQDSEIPKATLGSLWFYAKDNPISRISAFTDTLRNEIEIQTNNHSALLYLNKGKKVTIILEKEKLEGVIEKAAREEIYDGRYGNSNPNSPTISFNTIIFKTTDGRFVTLHEQDIKRIEFAEMPITVYKVPYKKPVNILSISFEKESNASELEAMYIQKGLQWSPFYHLQLLDDNNAQLTLRAEVINDIENLQNIDMSFVIGVPNFLFSNSLTGLVDFLKTTTNNNYMNQYLNVATQSNSASYGILHDMNPDIRESNFNNQIVGNNVGDLYFYKIPNFSMKKGEKSHLQLFTHKVKYEHIFECNLPKYDIQNRNYNYTNNDKIQVFHSAKIYNETTNPFTTGSCLITQKKENHDFPLGQDVLNYTSKKSNTYVKITETPDIKITQSEKIIDKSHEIFEFWGHNYYKVRIEGKIKVISYKADASKMELRYNIMGNTQKTNQEWKISQQEINLGSPNLNNLVCWDFTLKASEIKEITYEYETYVYQ